MPKIQGTTVMTNMRFPAQLLEDIDELIATGKTEYSDRTDFFKGAIRKELDWQQKKVKGLTVEISAEVEPPERR